MAKKRGNREGAFFKRGDGMWRYRIFVGYDEEGKQISKSFYGKTKAECKERAGAFQKDAEKGQAVFKNMPLGDWAQEWLETYKKDTVAPNTYAGYEFQLRHITEAAIAHMALSDIKPVHIKKFLSSKKNTSHSQITKLKAFLTSIFETAIDNDLCLKNPARNVKAPIIAQGKKDAFTDLEIKTILEYAATPDGRWFELAINTLLYTGLRRGELLGLMWEDIDFKDSMLKLRRAVAFGEGRELVTVTTNSRKNHTRDIPLDPLLLGLFRAEKEKARQRGLYIFATPTGGLIKPDNFGRTYQKFFRHLNAWCAENGRSAVRELTMHECRHTYATLLLRRGVDSRIRQELLGHADEEMTNNYTHVSGEMLKQAVGNIR